MIYGTNIFYGIEFSKNDLDNIIEDDTIEDENWSTKGEIILYPTNLLKNDKIISINDYKLVALYPPHDLDKNIAIIGFQITVIDGECCCDPTPELLKWSEFHALNKDPFDQLLAECCNDLKIPYAKPSLIGINNDCNCCS